MRQPWLYGLSHDYAYLHGDQVGRQPDGVGVGLSGHAGCRFKMGARGRCKCRKRPCHRARHKRRRHRPRPAPRHLWSDSWCGARWCRPCECWGAGRVMPRQLPKPWPRSQGTHSAAATVGWRRGPAALRPALVGPPAGIPGNGGLLLVRAPLTCLGLPRSSPGRAFFLGTTFSRSRFRRIAESVGQFLGEVCE